MDTNSFTATLLWVLRPICTGLCPAYIRWRSGRVFKRVKGMHSCNEISIAAGVKPQRFQDQSWVVQMPVCRLVYVVYSIDHLAQTKHFNSKNSWTKEFLDVAPKATTHSNDDKAKRHSLGKTGFQNNRSQWSQDPKICNTSKAHIVGIWHQPHIRHMYQVSEQR